MHRTSSVSRSRTSAHPAAAAGPFRSANPRRGGAASPASRCGPASAAGALRDDVGDEFTVFGAGVCFPLAGADGTARFGFPVRILGAGWLLANGSWIGCGETLL